MAFLHLAAAWLVDRDAIFSKTAEGKPMTSHERELGRLETKMANLEADLQMLQKDVREIRDAVVGYKGGWQMLSLLVAVSAGAGALLSKLPLGSLFFK